MAAGQPSLGILYQIGESGSEPDFPRQVAVPHPLNSEGIVNFWEYLKQRIDVIRPWFHINSIPFSHYWQQPFGVLPDSDPELFGHLKIIDDKLTWLQDWFEVAQELMRRGDPQVLETGLSPTRRTDGISDDWSLLKQRGPEHSLISLARQVARICEYVDDVAFYDSSNVSRQTGDDNDVLRGIFGLTDGSGTYPVAQPSPPISNPYMEGQRFVSTYDEFAFRHFSTRDASSVGVYAELGTTEFDDFHDRGYLLVTSTDTVENVMALCRGSFVECTNHDIVICPRAETYLEAIELGHVPQNFIDTAP